MSTICDSLEIGRGRIIVIHLRPEKALCVNDVPACYDQPLLSIEPFTNYRGGCYVNENEIARYSRAGVLVAASRCPRDSTRVKGDEKGMKSPARVASAQLKVWMCFELRLVVSFFFVYFNNMCAIMRTKFSKD